MFKKFLGLSMAVFLIMQCSPKETDPKGADAGGIRPQKVAVTFVLGKVFVKTEGKDWTAIKVGALILPKDMIRLQENSRVVLQTETGSVITMKDATEVVLNSLLDPKTGEEKTVVELNSGKAVVNPRKLEGNSSFAVRTPSMVAGVRGTIFSVEYKNGASRVAVKEGRVAVKPNISSVKGISEDAELQMPQTEVKPGEKAEVSREQVEQIAQSFQGETRTEQLQELQSAVQLKSLSEEESRVVEEDASTLVKLNIDIESQGVEGRENSLAPVTISSYGRQIFVNGTRVAEDYYSSLHEKGSSLDIEILKGTEKVHQEKVVVPADGVKLNFTSPEDEKESVDEISQEKTKDAFQLVGQGFPLSADELYQTGRNLILSSAGQIQIMLADQPGQSVKISAHPNVESALTPEGVFVVSRAGNLELYGFDGVRKAEVKLGNIIFKTAVSYANGIGYIANATGRIVGANASGDKVFDVSIKDSLVAPVAVYQDMVFAASAYKLYVIKAGRETHHFRLAGKVFKRMGVQDNRLILPQDNGKIAIVNFQGEIVKEISAVAGDITVISPEIFAVQYAAKTMIFNHKGEKLKEMPSGKTVFVGSRALYAEGQDLVVYDTASDREKRVELPEKIKSVGVTQGRAAVMSETGKLYHTDF